MPKAAQGPDPIDVRVGERLRIRRRWMGLSQTQLAQALGLTFQQIQKYEKGRNRISASMLVRAAAALETSVAYLVGQDGAEPAEQIIMANLSTPGAEELLDAFARIKDGESRRALLAVADAMAARAAA